MSLDSLKWNDAGLVTVVVQDRHTGEVRMVAHANKEALTKTLESGLAVFWSRSRKQLWQKGESSGHVINVDEVRVDCDGDALIYLGSAEGPSCHTGEDTCFYRALDSSADLHTSPSLGPTLERLSGVIDTRKFADAEKSYTRSLFEKGSVKIGEKLREEAGELADAIESESDENVIGEAADVMFHLLVGLRHRDVSLRDVQVELARRFGVSGHEEKSSRN